LGLACRRELRLNALELLLQIPHRLFELSESRFECLYILGKRNAWDYTQSPNTKKGFCAHGFDDASYRLVTQKSSATAAAQTAGRTKT
jgi:hypothetical protein